MAQEGRPESNDPEREGVKPTYQTLLGHIKHHNVRKWLLAGAKAEDANTIVAAIKRLTDGQLNRRFARMLERK